MNPENVFQESGQSFCRVLLNRILNTVRASLLSLPLSGWLVLTVRSP